MEIRYHFKRRNMVYAAIVAAVSLIAHFAAGISLFNTVMFILLYIAVKNLEIKLPEKLNWLWAVLATGFSIVLSTWLVQYLLLPEELRGKISQQKYFLNILCCLVVYLAVQLLVNNVGRGCMIAHIILLSFAGVNYFVYAFRGNELIFGDFKSLSTGLSVAGNYQFSLNAQAMNAILLTVVYVAGIRKLQLKFERKWLMRGVCVACAALSVAYVARKSEYTVTETWEQKGSYRNGYLLNFALSVRDSFVSKPEHYSEEILAKLEKEYSRTELVGEVEEPYAQAESGLGAEGNDMQAMAVQPLSEGTADESDAASGAAGEAGNAAALSGAASGAGDAAVGTGEASAEPDEIGTSADSPAVQGDSDTEAISDLETEYANADGQEDSESGEADAEDGADALEDEKPAIIVIMNESFADFDVVGNLVTNEEVTPFLNSLTENTVKGYALASVFGAKTPNSEWEFMTGNSMAWLPSGSVVYQQYLEEDNAYSIVDTLKNQDYTCVAMHPYYSTGWSRNQVYPKLGFDEMYFLDDFDQGNLMRRYVSDATMYDKIIERYEAGKGQENLFLMGITMQNHGGYTDYYENFNTDIRSLNLGYSDVNQYLSLIHQSDLALQNLVEYFSGVEEPVVICFFGDHQPSLNTSFYQGLNGKGLSGLTTDELEDLYTVPFFIWTNYESESRTVERTSLNYLSTMLLEKAQLPLPAYNQFLSDLMDVVPAMNSRAFYSEGLGKYVHYGQGTDEENEWLEQYEILQYNGLFDDKDKSEVFFGR